MAEFDAVKLMNKEILKKMGVQQWEKNEKTGKVLYLFPVEWFNNIPESYPVIDIFGGNKLFSKETHSGDARFGCLCYGFIK